MSATWHRVAPVMAGADVELLMIDAWGELSVGAERVSPADRDAIVGVMRAAVVRAGSPWWAVAAELWWQVERAVVAEDAAAAADAATQLAAIATRHPGVEVSAEAATTWVAVLEGRVSPQDVAGTTARLAAEGRRWEAAALCRAAVARAADPAAARELLGTGRGLRTTAPTPGRTQAGDLSEREREVGALVIDGLTHKEIGARLYISPKTVEQHVARLRQKLAASNRAALVAGLRLRLGS
jgi:DNA-binding CsgD family transcriptional regulator